jgi:glycosyltransferase involved in cell wall biosynthesis
VNIRLIYITDIRFPMERANAIQTINTCHSLARRGIEVHLLVRKIDDKSDKECLNYYGLDSIKTLHLNRLKVPKNSAKLMRFTFFFKSFFRIVLLSLTRKKLIYYTRDLKFAYVYSFIGKIFRAKTIFEAHTVSHRHTAEIHTLYNGSQKLASHEDLRHKMIMEGKIYRKINGVIAITEHLKRQIQDDFNPKCKIKVVRDAADPLEKPNADEKLNGIFYIGQLYPWKGVDILLKSMCLVNSGEILNIVGGLEYENDLENLKRLAMLLKIENKVNFIGNIPHKQVAEYIKKAKICVIPLPFSQIAAYYTSPMKMFEYLAAGKAIVASNLPSLTEVLKDGYNALLCKPDDPVTLADAINNLLRNGKLRIKLSENAWKDSHKYSWDNRAALIHKFTSEILTKSYED